VLLLRLLLTVALIAASSAALAEPARDAAEPVAAQSDRARIRHLGRIMAALAKESRADAARVDDVYGTAARGAGLLDRAALQSAIAEGAIARLPADVGRFNIAPRLAGSSPIGEKDLVYQPLYVAARPATLGLLFHVAARLPGTPLDVTSLVRHHEYQRALQRTNANARTAVPTHTLGLAFDISVLHMTPSEVEHVRDVLRHMRAEGDLFFVAETRQLVFHVVPTPARLDFYAAVYEALTSTHAPPEKWSSPDGLRFAASAPPDPDVARLEAEMRRLAAVAPPAALASLTLASTLFASVFHRRRRGGGQTTRFISVPAGIGADGFATSFKTASSSAGTRDEKRRANSATV
jgi:hypothetical protein